MPDNLTWLVSVRPLVVVYRLSVAGRLTTPQDRVWEGPPGAVFRYYYLEPGPPTRPIQHSPGLGDLLPLDFQVWESVKYEEVTFAAGDRTIIDARGEVRDGNCWRNIGVNNERVWYAHTG